MIISESTDDFERPTLRGCPFAANYGRVVASLQLLPCQKTKPKGLSLRVWALTVLPYLHILTTISGCFERPTLRGCTFATHRGRVVALLQHQPYQETKPKGLLGMFCRLTCEFITESRSLVCMCRAIGLINLLM
ncbi:hypothetical protein GCWU000325_00890 [Alloprevotella tannerae ATCC 51259]|uniref:Uncharacterized protein n=1 Tax=Alloprevotella tannerae ATCC 51259 TaxID=626522 RepID=C9LFA8_9BACT|nr:hypothetical protein GCWU000325_00890 [Alloprevotella tannerae ATCC 51259]